MIRPMTAALYLLGWISCVVYSTIPSFWFLIHPFADYWRSHQRSPYIVLLPAWIAMWIIVAAITFRWRNIVLYTTHWQWIATVILFALGFWIYSRSGKQFSARQLGGLPEVINHHREQRLVISGIRARVRHPVYLAHLCEMVGWSLGTGLIVCYGLTAFAVITGAVMIRMEDEELEQRFGMRYLRYRDEVPAVLPRISGSPKCPRKRFEDESSETAHQSGYIQGCSQGGKSDAPK
jgi:protein-S-isoprenylcysteine O-methyltransferase Ste14